MEATEPSRIFPCFDPLDAGRNTQTYRSQHPQTRDELFSYSHLILGHFTSSTFLPSIIAHGLEPDFEHKRVMDSDLPSDIESVYLCSRYDRFYIRRVVEHHGGRGIAILVCVPVAELVADECALSSDARGRTLPDVQLFLSLCFGTCKYLGTIPTSSFVGIFDADGKQIQ